MKFISVICRFSLLILLVQTIFMVSCNRKNSVSSDRSFAEIKATGDSIQKDFSKISKWTDYLAEYTQQLFEKKIILKRETLLFSENGILYKEDDGGGAVYCNSTVPYNSEVGNTVSYTSSLDSLFSDAVDSLGFLVKQAGYYDKNSVMRIYPFIDVRTQFSRDFDVRNYVYYLNADPEHNPNRKNILISIPYADPAGRGWILSSASPVYVQNIFQGVICLDIDLDTFLKRYISGSVPNILIVDSSGVCIAIDDDKAGIFNLPLRKNVRYLQKKYYDEFSGDEINLLKSTNKNIRSAFNDLLKNNKTISELELKEENYILYSYKIPELCWYIIKFENI